MFKVKKQARYRDDNLCCVQVNKAPVFNLFSSNLMYYKPLDYNKSVAMLSSCREENYFLMFTIKVHGDECRC